MKTVWPIKVKFGEVTCSEAEVMLNASAESGTNPMAESILTRYYELGGCTRREFELTREQAEYLRDEFSNESDRVAMGAGEAAGRAFEKAGEKLDKILNPTLP